MFDFFIAMLTLYYCIIVPYRIGFAPHVQDNLKWIELFFDICFFVDIGLRFRCAYVEDVMIVDDGFKIAKKYLRGWF